MLGPSQCTDACTCARACTYHICTRDTHICTCTCTCHAHAHMCTCTRTCTRTVTHTHMHIQCTRSTHPSLSPPRLPLLRGAGALGEQELVAGDRDAVGVGECVGTLASRSAKQLGAGPVECWASTWVDHKRARRSALHRESLRRACAWPVRCGPDCVRPVGTACLGPRPPQHDRGRPSAILPRTA